MAQVIQHDFTIPNPKIVTVQGADGKPQQLQVYDAITLGPALRTIKSALDSLAGRGTGPTQMTGQLSLNSNKITGVVNSAAPTSDEAVSYGLAQTQYSVFRPSVSNQTSSSTVQAGTGTTLAQANNSPTNQTLAPASTVLGRCFTIKKTDPSTNPVYVTTSRDPVTGNPDTIDGKANYKLGTNNQYVTVQATSSGAYSVVAEGTGDPFEIMQGKLVDIPLLAPAQLYLATDTDTIYVGTFSGNLQVSQPILHFADAETPVDSGDHQHFTLAHSPSPAASLILSLSRAVEVQGTDYTLSGASLVMASAIVGAFTLQAWYRW